ncbi:hypothetical protein [Phytohabitans houttuyneae]|uniref:Uncharacterized protein n=1 Tax=Phytohabitans houttuyneae TaxID=1076126 RepID=A0A6V8KAG9_9ACTN|nr:hypothetical protein [Phytohabitans houttuyneae]GFJ79378.1 hypothetical protein Phou_035580 [Phytohabitans houttuyneae]
MADVAFVTGERGATCGGWCGPAFGYSPGAWGGWGSGLSKTGGLGPSGGALRSATRGCAAVSAWLGSTWMAAVSGSTAGMTAVSDSRA